MKKWYVGGVVVLFVVLVPLLTIGAGAVWALWLRYLPHWGERKGFYTTLAMPLILATGVLPQVTTQLWLMSRYGPRLELLSYWVRQIVDLVPLLLWGVTSILVLFIIIITTDGKAVIGW